MRFGDGIKAARNGCFFLFEKIVIFILKGNDMNILSNDKMELKYDEYEMEFVLTVYDRYGHYIDEVVLTRDDVNDLFTGLEKNKDSFQ